MSLSKVKIANMALSNVGDTNTIEALPPDETSIQATTIDLWYDTARQEALKAYDWSFARKRAILALHGDAAADEWAYRYQYPSDALHIRKLVHPSDTQGDPVPYEVMESTDGTMCILTNLETANAFYTKDEETVTRFTPDFVIAFAYSLAGRIAMGLTSDSSIRDTNLGLAVATVQQAGSANGNQEVDRRPRDAEWVEARTGTGGIPDARVDRS